MMEKKVTMRELMGDRWHAKGNTEIFCSPLDVCDAVFALYARGEYDTWDFTNVLSEASILAGTRDNLNRLFLSLDEKWSRSLNEIWDDCTAGICVPDDDGEYMEHRLRVLMLEAASLSRYRPEEGVSAATLNETWGYFFEAWIQAAHVGGLTAEDFTDE